MPKYLLRALLFISLLWVLPAVAAARTKSVDEYLIKAILLGRFPQFVTWPAGSLRKDGFFLCTIGSNPFGDKLNSAYRKRRILDKPVIIQTLSDVDEVDQCNVLFIGRLAKNELDRLFLQLVYKPILTVADTRGYAKQGVMLNFYVKDRKIRFEINMHSLAAAELKMSYTVLRLGKIIETEAN